MALAKYYADIVEQRRENGAAIVDEFDYPRAASAASPDCPDESTGPQEKTKVIVKGGRILVFKLVRTEGRLTMRDRAVLQSFVMKLQSDSQRVDSELISQTFDWSPAHFQELGTKSPEALVRLAMAYRDEIKRAA